MVSPTITTLQIDQLYLYTIETLQDVSDGSVSLTCQFQHPGDVSGCFMTFWVTITSHDEWQCFKWIIFISCETNCSKCRGKLFTISKKGWKYFKQFQVTFEWFSSGFHLIFKWLSSNLQFFLIIIIFFNNNFLKTFSHTWKISKDSPAKHHQKRKTTKKYFKKSSKNVLRLFPRDQLKAGIWLWIIQKFYRRKEVKAVSV